MLGMCGTNNDFAININLVFLQVPSSRSTTNESLRYSRIVMKLLKMSWMAAGSESSNTINFHQHDSESLWNLGLIPDISIYHNKELRITRLVIYRGTLSFTKTQVDILTSKNQAPEILQAIIKKIKNLKRK